MPARPTDKPITAALRKRLWAMLFRDFLTTAAGAGISRKRLLDDIGRRYDEVLAARVAARTIATPRRTLRPRR